MNDFNIIILFTLNIQINSAHIRSFIIFIKTLSEIVDFVILLLSVIAFIILLELPLLLIKITTSSFFTMDFYCFWKPVLIIISQTCYHEASLKLIKVIPATLFKSIDTWLYIAELPPFPAIIILLPILWAFIIKSAQLLRSLNLCYLKDFNLFKIIIKKWIFIYFMHFSSHPL
jgi:hypothetical protein